MDKSTTSLPVSRKERGTVLEGLLAEADPGSRVQGSGFSSRLAQVVRCRRGCSVHT